MTYQFSVEDIQKAQQVHYFDHRILYIVDEDQQAYGFRREDQVWFRDDDFWDYFESELMLSCFTPITRDEAAQLYLTWCYDPAADIFRWEKAIGYAVREHAWQLRKGSVCPKVTHSLETLQILTSMDADVNLQIAGVLHDTREEAEEIGRNFSWDVFRLIFDCSEDLSLPWRERKSQKIRAVADGDRRLRMLAMADVVADLRQMTIDRGKIGDALWNRFDAPVDQLAWYYSAIQDVLWDMQRDPRCAPVYWEMVGLFKDLFVRYYLLPEEALFQVCADGTVVCLKKGNPEWKAAEAAPPEGQIIGRREAERLEDNWNAPFYQLLEEDLAFTAFKRREKSPGS